MKIKNTSDQNIEGFTVENEKCDFPAGEINNVPESLGEAALEKYDFLEEVKEKKETAKEKKEREKAEKDEAKAAKKVKKEAQKGE